MSQQREQLASRLGFILLTAGCAIGLGNIWRFPYIVGKNGGGFFVILYLLCLALMGFPILLFELSLGRAGRSTFPGAFRNLKSKVSKFKWEVPAFVFFAGNMILLMFYSVVTGWLFAYMCNFMCGNETVMDKVFFSDLLAAPGEQILYLAISLLVTILICAGGVQKCIEKSIKFMMLGLLLLLVILIVKVNTLPGAGEGVSFFLKPNLNNFINNPWGTLYDAMTQAFFTLSLGIGSIAICGSYTSKEKTLAAEGCWIIGLDTLVAICAGFIIFPACYAFKVQPDAGPSLIFITLPNVFREMSLSFFWGSLFFAFLFVAALSTLIAVFENLVAFGMDEYHWSRKKSASIFGIVLSILSLPCVFGFNIWKHIQLNGKSILDLEDFIVSQNLLPLGALYLTIFCMYSSGWGEEKCLAEINTGSGLRFSKYVLPYAKYFLPLIIFAIWLSGIITFFQ
ncbi:MAG: sodium-dependent transporter [Lentisphaeria bacterium]|nr:sodium-dependent transporter [Lentisphaeria bacterium]